MGRKAYPGPPYQDEMYRLMDAVLKWWDEHQYDCDGSYNRYTTPPDFVQIAMQQFAEYDMLRKL